jgi:hypothetical protein
MKACGADDCGTVTAAAVQAAIAANAAKASHQTTHVTNRQKVIGQYEMLIGAIIFGMGVGEAIAIPELVVGGAATSPFTGGASFVAGLVAGVGAVYGSIVLMTLGVLVFVDGYARTTGQKTVAESLFGTDPFADPGSPTADNDFVH